MKNIKNSFYNYLYIDKEIGEIRFIFGSRTIPRSKNKSSPTEFLPYSNNCYHISTPANIPFIYITKNLLFKE